jgi:hypothetical protein
MDLFSESDQEFCLHGRPNEQLEVRGSANVGNLTFNLSIVVYPTNQFLEKRTYSREFRQALPTPTYLVSLLSPQKSTTGSASHGPLDGLLRVVRRARQKFGDFRIPHALSMMRFGSYGRPIELVPKTAAVRQSML